MRQTAREQQQTKQTRQSQMMTGNTKSKDVQKTMKERRTDHMTDYLENRSISPTIYKQAQLTPEEKEAALKAIKYYKSLSLEEIENLLEADNTVATSEKKHKKRIEDRTKAALLATASVIIIVFLCWTHKELCGILIPLAISFEAAFVSQQLLFKGAYKK